MKNKFLCLYLIFAMFFGACSTASNIEGGGYAGIYESPENISNKFVIDYRNELSRIQYFGLDKEWEGVGYEMDGRIVAVLRPLEEEGEAVFVTISFPGNDRLFVVMRNTEGGYLSDEYFQKRN